MNPVHVIGGGLAGSEAAWQLARAGVSCVLHEMRPVRRTEAHVGAGLAELVCSNSFRSDDPERNAVGLLHEEMRRCGSLILAAADRHKVPAGGALAVDRIGFSEAVEAALTADPLVEIRREEIAGLPPSEWDEVIIATGPLTSASLADALAALTGEESLAFFDAIAPIVYRETIDFDTAWFQSRYDKGEGADYINCPLDREQYEAFVARAASRRQDGFPRLGEIDAVFRRLSAGRDHGGARPRHAALGADEAGRPARPAHRKTAPCRRPAAPGQCLGHALQHGRFPDEARHGEQTRIFRMIPGLERAEFARLGGLHRNTFINSPRLLDGALRLKAMPRLRFAGQITGVEGYVESAAIGLLAGRFAAAARRGHDIAPPPETTALGALLRHITGGAQSRHVPADERQFRPVPATFARSRDGTPIANRWFRAAHSPIWPLGASDVEAAS